MKAQFSHLSLSPFEGSLARKIRIQFLKYISHERFVFTTSTFSLGGTPRTNCSFRHLQLAALGTSRMKASFPLLQLSVFEGCLARGLRFHCLDFLFLGDASHKMRV